MTIQNMQSQSVIFLFYAVTLLGACCKKHDSNNGDIKMNLDMGSTGNTRCLNITDTFCIRTDSAYHAFFIPNTLAKSCGPVELPFIDFSENTVLGHAMVGRHTFFHRNVTIDWASKIVTYEITVDQCGCADVCVRHSLNAVLIPKIPNDFKVIYK